MPQTDKAYFNEIALFTGIEQSESFANLKSLLHVRAMRPAAGTSPWPQGPESTLPHTYRHRGAVRELDELLAATRTGALLVIKDGRVCFERYWRSGGLQVQWISMSVAKSFVSALVGIALAQRAIHSLEDPIDKYVTSLGGSAYRGVRILDILRMSSGVRWDEDYSNTQSDVFRISTAMGRHGSLDEFISQAAPDTSAGTLCRYNSGDTQALGMLVCSATGRSLAEYMQENLLEPLQVESPSYWLIDGKGRELAFAGLNMTARDYARLGELYRNGGRWNGVQVVPSSYVAASVSVAAPHLAAGKPLIGGHAFDLGYGYQWWLPPGGEGEFCALGVYNQLIYVNRAHGTVIVKLSANPAYGTSTEEAVNRDFENIEALRAVSSHVTAASSSTASSREKLD